MSKLTIVLKVEGEDYPDFNVTRDDPSTNVLAGLTVEVRPDLLAFTVDPRVGDSRFVFLHPDDLRMAIAARVRDQGIANQLVPHHIVPRTTRIPISQCQGIRKYLPR